MIVILLSAVAPVNASVILNEVFADPAGDLSGDANGDGVRSGTDDEFIELLNNGAVEWDISGWALSDSVATRHIFPSKTVLPPYTFLVVFGGGSPLLSGVHWQTASSGALGLNNSGDTVSLYDSTSQLMDQLLYGSIAGQDQSITLFPDGQMGEFVLHSSIEEAQGALFSPGMSVDARLSLALGEGSGSQSGSESPIVPEIPTLLYFGMGWGSIFLRRNF